MISHPSQYDALTGSGIDFDGGGADLIDEGSHDCESTALRNEEATASIPRSAASKAPALKLLMSFDTPLS